MADYYSPTVIQQTIPEADMTPLERLILSHIFDTDAEDGGLYFYSEQGPSDVVLVSRAELVDALAASRNQESVANVLVAEQLNGAAPSDDRDEIELDLRTTSWEFLLQNIVQRSPMLRYITAITSYMCSKMRPDGFGGSALFITADAVRGHSTDEFLADCLADIAADPADQPGRGHRPPPSSDGGEGDATD
jgi:hypothetical protein